MSDFDCVEEPDEKEEASRSAREFHSRDEQQEHVLSLLRQGGELTKHDYERNVGDGGRLAPVIEQLRNAHGFLIAGHGTMDKPYLMEDRLQLPRLARVTPDMQKAYYETEHWQEVKNERLSFDGFRCAVSGVDDDLQCHHFSYARLFCEPLTDLITVCRKEHEKIHRNCRLKFPSGLPTELAERLGWCGFETWLLPKW